MNRENGMRHWVFCDGDLPPAGETEPFGHESLMMVNLCKERAEISIDILFEDREPAKGIMQYLEGERVICMRLDKPIGEQKFQIPMGQYALVINSSVPIVAVFGRLDVRQANMAYYSVQGYAY